MHPVASRAIADQAGDVDSLRAAEQAALQAIAKRFRPDGEEAFVEFLSRPGRTVTSAQNPELAQMLGTYYAIRNQRWQAERIRNSVAAARHSTTSALVVVSDSALTVVRGTRACLWRRRNELPANVIVLASNATSGDLGAAISALEKSRTERGDDLIRDEKTFIASAVVANVDGKTLEHLTSILVSLRSAPLHAIDGIGMVRGESIEVRPGR
jgi:hypothetical protein